MKKIIFELSITICLFIGLWFGFSQIDWVNIFRIDELNAKTEEQLGDLRIELEVQKELLKKVWNNRSKKI